jgi:hypothetical protein
MTLYDCHGEEIKQPALDAKKKGDGLFGMFILLCLMVVLAFFGGRASVVSDTAETPTKAIPAKPVDAQHGWMVPPQYEAPKDADFGNVETEQGSWTIWYTTKERLETLGCEAYTSMERRTIYMPTDASLAERQSYLFHEIDHIAVFIGGGMETRLAYLGPEEELIDPSAPKLLDILRRNPRMAEWLLRKERP